jgi:hypothetical protein
MVECFGGYISSEHEYFGKIIGHATKDVGWQNNIPLIILNDPSILKLNSGALGVLGRGEKEKREIKYMH